MVDQAKRLRRAFGNMAASEALAGVLDEETVAFLLKWSETVARQFVLKTIAMDDDAADEFLAPYSSALRRMMRAIGIWAVEKDADVRLEWWNRIEQNGKTLYGDRFVIPGMESVLIKLPPDADVKVVIAFIQKMIEDQKAKVL